MRDTDMLINFSGYVAVAVSTAHGTYTREVETGNNDREKKYGCFCCRRLEVVERNLAQVTLLLFLLDLK